jgi:hypothetical protein
MTSERVFYIIKFQFFNIKKRRSHKRKRKNLVKRLLFVGIVVVSKEKKTCIFFLIPYGVPSKGHPSNHQVPVFRNDWIGEEALYYENFFPHPP